MKKSWFQSQGFRWGVLSLLALALVLGALLPHFYVTRAADVTDGLDVEIIAAYNLIVDSNVMSPSTQQPNVATVIGKFCNTDTTDTLTDVVGYIGDYGGDGPGDYPDNTPGTISGGGVSTDYVGTYQFQNLGGTADATRYIGSLAPGECSYQYWSFVYPKYASNTTPGANNIPAWGTSVKPGDDLWLEFDIWAEGTGATTNADNETWRMTMRNEISAMANKIEPNGNPGGQWFNTDTSTINPGQTVTTNGILYRLGNVNQGFDNDDDGVPDYNAWLQPFGSEAYDPSCFRLVETSGVLTVTTNTGDVVVPFSNNLYFTDLPSNNTNTVGKVYYTFLALGGACTIPITPYQEAASGSDNEKFNGDYGSGPAPVQTFEPSVSIDKTGSPAAGATGALVTYTIGFENSSPDADAGIVLSSGTGGTIGLVISDDIPTGMTYVAGSAAANNDIPVAYTILYYDSGTSSWTTTEPATAANVTSIQWWLDEPLPKDTGSNDNYGSVTFQATLPGTAPVPPFVENCADASFGAGDPFDTSCTVTMIEGTNEIGDYVWWDANSDGVQDASESGIDNVTVSLYYDKNGDGALDDGDVFISTQTTAGGGAYSFTSLADGDFIVVVDDQDTDITDNRLVPTTRTVYAVTGLGSTLASPYLYADFGFGPVLSVSKTLTSSNPAYEGEEVTWEIYLTNTLPGDGSGQPSTCSVTDVFWANGGDANGSWTTPENAYTTNEVDMLYAVSPFGGQDDDLRALPIQMGQQAGTIQQVEAIYLLNVDTSGGTLGTSGSSADEIQANIQENLTWNAAPILSQLFDNATLNATPTDALFAFDVTSLESGDGWQWSDFSKYYVSINAHKNASADGAILNLNSLGWRVTYDETCGGAEDTVVTVPLTDEFDASLFEFVSADPEPDSATTGTGDTYNPAGLITWDNLGPLYAGQTKTVTVVLKALEPTTNPENTVNYARVRNAEFANGSPVNDGDASDDVDIVPTGTIGDLVWNDIDGNGTYEPNGADSTPNTADDERGLADVTVYLCTTTPCNSGTAGVRTTVTDANGLYLFEAVYDGTNYYVAVDTTTLPTGAVNSHDRDGNNDNITTAMTINNTDGVTTNDDITDADFGYTLPALILGSVWHDYDHSATATPDDGEEGLSGVWVYVDDGSCTYISPGGGTCLSTQTDANGDFEIDITSLNPGTGTTYNVVVDSATLPAGSWTQSYDTPNGPDGLPGTGDDATSLDHTVPVTVVAGGQGRADYSYYQTGSSSIGDTIFTDWNGNAQQDTDEAGVPNVTVYLYEDSSGDGVIDPDTDALIATDTTDTNGEYLFENLPAGNYIVMVDEADLPWDYTQTYDPDNGPQGTPCGTCDGQSVVTTDGSSEYLDEDFGYQPVGYGSIGDYVWQDDDGDGLQDAGEAALPDIKVQLYVWNDDGDGVYQSGEEGALVAEMDSASDGSYLFENLPAGKYLVDVDEGDGDLPAGDVVSSHYDDDDDLTTPDITNDPMAVTLSEGENFLDADFGFVAGGSIGDFVWQDNDGDGLWDSNEPGISGVDVTLYNDVNGNGVYDSGTDTQVGSPTTTDGSGNYIFEDLPAGDYVVVVSQPAGFTLTGDPDAYSGAGCADPYPPYNPACTYEAFDNQYGTSLLGGTSDLNADFGYQPSAYLGDTVWIDANDDGVKDAGEYGIPFITVNLYSDVTCTTLADTTATDENGTYSFGDLSNGDYCVEVDTTDTDWPANVATTNTVNGDPDGVADNHTTATVGGGLTTVVGSCLDAGGACALTADFGYLLNGSHALSGTVFFDGQNNGGLYDGGTDDAPYEGVTVYLRDSNGILIATTTTAADGSYSFTHLPDDTYRVILDTDSPQLRALTATREPDADPCGGACNGNAYVTISGADSPDNDFGFYGDLDFGDLPDTYNSSATQYTTKFSSGGPYHTLGSLYLGAYIDAENDGVPDAAAVSDDNNASPNDEDGVTRDMVDYWVPTATVQLNVTTSASGGYLVGWFDFNGDGDFNDPNETKVYGSVPSGTSTLNLTLPSTYVAGSTVNARFRLYDGAPAFISPTGGAINGEVEDYQWTFGPNAVSLAAFRAQVADMRWLLGFAGLMLLAVVGSLFWWMRRQKVTNR